MKIRRRREERNTRERLAVGRRSGGDALAEFFREGFDGDRWFFVQVAV